MSGHGAHADPSNKKIALLIAILALFLAISETLSKAYQTEVITKQVEASNLWAFFQAWRRSEKMQHAMDRFALRMPVFGDLVYKSVVARWTRTLSTMFAAGVPLVEALDSVGGAAGTGQAGQFSNAVEIVAFSAVFPVGLGGGAEVCIGQCGGFARLPIAGGVAGGVCCRCAAGVVATQGGVVAIAQAFRGCGVGARGCVKRGLKGRRGLVFHLEEGVGLEHLPHFLLKLQR